MDDHSKKVRKPRQRVSDPAAVATDVAEPVRPPIPDLNELRALLAGEHANPHAVLGAHPLEPGSDRGLVIRVMHPNAVSVECVFPDGAALAMERLEGGIFHIAAPEARFPARH